MASNRRAYQSGHQPKCLVLVDDSEECGRAVYFASRWAARSGGAVVTLRVIEPEDIDQQWIGVADVMRTEAEDEANAALDRAAGQAYAAASVTPERVIRKGETIAQILEVIDQDPDITRLVLAASTGAEGPGPLITHLAKMAGILPVPLMIVPGGLADEAIDAVA